MIKAVVFDLDDTLISEKEYIKSGFNEVSCKISSDHDLDSKVVYKVMYSEFEIHSKNVFNRALDRLNIDYNEDYILSLVECYRSHKPNIKFYEDVVACVRTLKEQEIKTGIITDGYGITQKAKLEVLEAYELFDNIIITDELGREFWKPHPKAFELMVEKLNIKFNEMVYIGDNPKKDFYISSIYPIMTIRINREQSLYYNEDYLKGIKEMFTISDINSILNYIA